MYILQSKSKHVPGQRRKTTSVVVENLGTFSQIREKYHTDDPEAWARAHLEELNEKEQMHTKLLKYKESDKNDSVCAEAGYLFLQKIFYELRLDEACEAIKNKRKIKYNLVDWMKSAIYGRILYPTSCWGTWERRGEWIEPLEYEYHQGMRAMDVVQEDVEDLCAHLFKTSNAIRKRKVRFVYYDCSNFWFEIEHPDPPGEGLRAFGKGKQRSDLPLAGMGLAIDEEHLPIMTIAFRGSNEQPTYDRTIRFLKRIGLWGFTFCTDGGLSGIANRAHATYDGVTYLTVLSLKKMEKSEPEEMKWCMDTKGWGIANGPKDEAGNTYQSIDISKLPAWDADKWIESGQRKDVGDTVYIKHRRYRRKVVEKWHSWTSSKGEEKETYSCSMETISVESDADLDKENTVETKEWFSANKKSKWKSVTYEFTETVVVTFSEKGRLKQAHTRIDKKNRAKELIAEGRARDSHSYGCSEYIKTIHSMSATGEVADVSEYFLNEEAIKRDALFEGFYVLATSDRTFTAEEAVEYNKLRWMDEDEFRFSKSGVKLRPFFVRKDERIEAHMIMFLVADLIFGLLMIRLNENERETGRHFTRDEVLKALRAMSMSYIPCLGVYVPAISNSEASYRIYEAFGMSLDRQFFTKQDMDKLIKKSRSRKVR